MAETLLAILLVTTSAKGSNLVFRWPPFPEASPRLCRPKPDNQVFVSQLDNPWRASLSHQNTLTLGSYNQKSTTDESLPFSAPGSAGVGTPGVPGMPVADDDDKDYANDPEYRWERPGSSNSQPTSSSSKRIDGPYEQLLGYSCEFLATLLCPQKSMCHQRFELVVDDLAFIGHPVCAEESVGDATGASAATSPSGGTTGTNRWMFKQEKVKPSSRGREKEGVHRHGQGATGHAAPRTSIDRKGIPLSGLGHHLTPGGSSYDSYHHHWTAGLHHGHTHILPPGSAVSSLAASPEKYGGSESATSTVPPSAAQSPSSSWLEKFQLVLVLDLPDPSSSASGNVAKYFEVIYEQIAFTFTAVLFQEQVLDNFVERECDALISLQESLLKKEEPYQKFVEEALQTSSIATAMRSVYDAIKGNAIAYISLNGIPLELQLPPHLDDLLHGEGEYDADSVERPDDEELQNWGPELSFGWKLPELAPWKSLLLLEGENDLNVSLRGGNIAGEERALAESVARFLDAASITLSLAELGNSLDWDLETQVYPVVRWLVLHRRAKVVDTVNQALKTIFALPSKFPQPLSTLAEEFRSKFSQQPEIPSLPQILASISSSLAKQSDNHFFASVVKKKEYVPMYQEVAEWMLRRDLLVTLHLRIRIVATRELKIRVHEARQRALERRLARKRLAERSAKDRARGGVGIGKPPSQRRGAGGGGGSGSGGKFDEFDAGDEAGLGQSGSLKTPSGLTAFMSLSPSKRTLSGSMITRGRPGAAKGGNGGLRRLSSNDSRGTSISELVIREEDDDDLDTSNFDDETGFDQDGNYRAVGDDDGSEYLVDDDDGQEEREEEEAEDDDSDLSGSEEEEETFDASMINDPGRATPRQRRWLTAMSDGQESHIAKRFELINQYFDGKRSDDEILYRAEITRRQLREVLHHYEPYLQTFLHPS